MASVEPIKKEGIVIRRTEVKDSDAMINCIGPDGRFSFYAKGVRKMSSKNAPALGELTRSEFVLLSSSNGTYNLKEAAPIESYVKEGDLYSGVIGQFLCELVARLFNEEEAEGKEYYPFLREALSAVYGGFEPFTAGFVCFAKALACVGFGLDVDRCVRCGSKKNIVALSYPDGGYVCADCFEEGVDTKLSPTQLKILRYAFRCGVEDVSRVVLEKNDLLPLYEQLGQYLYDATGIIVKSLDFLLKI